MRKYKESVAADIKVLYCSWGSAVVKALRY
jgi:hypothetical protein